MNPEVKQLWTEALRSEEFTQAKGCLRDEDGMCCLGVLCELHRRAVGGEWTQQYKSWRYLGEGATLPEEVKLWAGLDQDNPGISPLPGKETYVHEDGEEEEILCLAVANDGGYSFTEIAYLIEAQL